MFRLKQSYATALKPFKGRCLELVVYELFKWEVVPPAGIEPATFGLQNRCSTI